MLTDHELDAEYKSNQTNNTKPPRPQSTLAREFADQLNDVFLLDDKLDMLDQTVNRKKQSVSYQSSELAILEARLKEAERLLEEKKKRLSAHSSPNGFPRHSGSPSHRCPVPDYTQNASFSSTPEAGAVVNASAEVPKGAEEKNESGDESARLPAPEVSAKEEYVVIEKTPSVMDARVPNGKTDYPQQYQVRPPPPPPAVPTTI